MSTMIGQDSLLSSLSECLMCLIYLFFLGKQTSEYTTVPLRNWMDSMVESKLHCCCCSFLAFRHTECFWSSHRSSLSGASYKSSSSYLCSLDITYSAKVFQRLHLCLGIFLFPSFKRNFILGSDVLLRDYFNTKTWINLLQQNFIYWLLYM